MTALPKQYRLPGRAFEEVYQQGKNWRGAFLGLKVRRRTGQTKSRFGFAVGLKTSKKATRRNRLKRQLKAAVYDSLAQLKPGFDVVVLAYPGALDQACQAVRQELIKLLKKAGLWLNSPR